MAVVRRIIAHAIHGHRMPGSYENAFSALARLNASQRVIDLKHQVIAIPHISYAQGRYILQFAEGTPGINPVVLDSSSGETRVDELRRSEVLTDVSHLLVIPDKRIGVMEYVRRGAKAALMSQTIEGILRSHNRNYREFRIEMAPLIREDFKREIRSFSRIRIAEIAVTRPNAGWSDRYDDLSKLLEDSDGHVAHVDVRAGRGESLSKNKGIVGIIDEAADQPLPNLKDAKLTGTKKTEDNETTVSLENHTQHTRVRVNADDNGLVNSTDLANKMSGFLRSIGLIQ